MGVTVTDSMVRPYSPYRTFKFSQADSGIHRARLPRLMWLVALFEVF